MSDKTPPCDCIELDDGEYSSRCYCSNRDDGERAAAWCAQANLADTITRLTARVKELEGALKLFECDCEGAEYCARREHCRNYLARAALSASQPAPQKEGE